MKKLLLLFFIPLQIFASSFSEMKVIPLLDGGRVKPYHTFANESLHLVYGKRNYKSKSAEEIVFSWMLLPEVWQENEFIQIDYRALKESLKLDVKRKHFSPVEILASPRLQVVFQDLQNKVEAQQKLDAFFQQAQSLQAKLQTFNAIATGLIPAWMPTDDPAKWKNWQEMNDKEREKFARIQKGFVAKVSDSESLDLQKAVSSWVSFAKASSKNSFSEEKIALEIHYNDFNAFRWAWIAYLLCGILIVLSVLLKINSFRKLALSSLIVGFLMHTYGFALRVMLTGRPPVSNMYESVIWVAWGCILFTFFIGFKKKNYFSLVGGSLCSAFGLMIADFSPTILDPTLQPLEAVLRSNLWLTVHVLTITLGYAAYLLAFGVSNIALYYYLKDEKKHLLEIKDMSLSVYRALQIGTVLLAAGTILGGVWADYSWGRFWGWDPKETWALIALLGYVAILHARLAGLIHQFGLFIGSAAAFSLVIMAWYGVNYVLGEGLHSYGFGGGGVEYVSFFVLLEFVYLFTVYFVRSKKKVASP